MDNSDISEDSLDISSILVDTSDASGISEDRSDILEDVFDISSILEDTSDISDDTSDILDVSEDTLKDISSILEDTSDISEDTSDSSRTRRRRAFSRGSSSSGCLWIMAVMNAGKRCKRDIIKQLMRSRFQIFLGGT